MDEAKDDSRYIEMKKIKDDLMNLTSSPLYEYRTKNSFFPVIGEGNHHAHVMFVGEAPGENEAKTGRPFCGAAGRVLDELLASVDISRKDVYITNIVKDRPPNNRDPLPAEIDIYAPFLDRQIQIIKPEVIATLGRFSMEWVMRHFNLESRLGPISAMHGKMFPADLPHGSGSVTIVPLYHPAVALYKATMKTELMEDFKVLRLFG